jgi:uncharacterized FlgJ-related protein
MKKKPIIAALVIAFTMQSGAMRTPSKNIPPVIKSAEKVEPIDSTVLTKDMLVEYILTQDIAHPEIAYAIIRQESNMCSELFKSNKNLFGMKQPGVRPTMSKGPKYGFASFEKWQHSVLDYKLYLEFVGGHKMTRDSYLSHLDRNYAHKGYSSYIIKFFAEFYSYANN